MPATFSRGTQQMIEDILFWVICAAAAIAVWWAFLAKGHHPAP
jgi:hypothetical protein